MITSTRPDAVKVDSASSSCSIWHTVDPIFFFFFNCEGCAPLRVWHIPLLSCIALTDSKHFILSARLKNVTPDIRTKKAICANQAAQVEKINVILSERKVRSNICSIRELHGPDGLACSCIASAPLGKQTIFLFGHRVRSRAGARLAIFILVRRGTAHKHSR